MHAVRLQDEAGDLGGSQIHGRDQRLANGGAQDGLSVAGAAAIL
jgi:alpha-D-ribose 1-methylphosphonate 5-triphosphate synthase subunit PhnG